MLGKRWNQFALGSEYRGLLDQSGFWAFGADFGGGDRNLADEGLDVGVRAAAIAGLSSRGFDRLVLDIRSLGRALVERPVALAGEAHCLPAEHFTVWLLPPGELLQRCARGDVVRAASSQESAHYGNAEIVRYLFIRINACVTDGRNRDK